MSTSNDLFDLAYQFGNMSFGEVQDIIGNPDDWSNFSQKHTNRRIFTVHFGWSVPCKDAVEAIKSHTRQPLFDVLAGTGYWAEILKQAGINVIASDIHKAMKKNYYHNKSNVETHLRRKTPKRKIIRRNALKVAYHLRTGRLQGDLLISWPPYQESFAFDVLTLVPIGTRIMYIGEGEGGCTADAAFHRYLDLNFTELCFVPLPQFSGIHDNLTIYEKQTEHAINPKMRGVCFFHEEEDDTEEAQI